MTDKAVSFDDVDPKAIQQLFDKNPLEITDAELHAIIKFNRQERARFMAEESKGKKGRPASANIDYTQLDIEL